MACTAGAVSARCGGGGGRSARARPGLALTGAPRANALTDAPRAIRHGRCRSIAPGEGRPSARRTPDTLQSQGVRHAGRGSSNQVLQRTAAGAGVPLSIDAAAA